MTTGSHTAYTVYTYHYIVTAWVTLSQSIYPKRNAGRLPGIFDDVFMLIIICLYLTGRIYYKPYQSLRRYEMLSVWYLIWFLLLELRRLL